MTHVECTLKYTLPLQMSSTHFELMQLNFGLFPSDCSVDRARVNVKYKGADKSLARPTSQCILFDGENISFDASLVIYK